MGEAEEYLKTVQSKKPLGFDYVIKFDDALEAVLLAEPPLEHVLN